MKITVDLTRFTKIQHDREFLKNRDAIKNPLGKCFYPGGASRGRIYNWLTSPDGGVPRLALVPANAFSWLANRSKVKQKGRTGRKQINWTPFHLFASGRQKYCLLFKVSSF